MSKDQVKIWEEVVSIPTYGVGKPDINPMFLEKRVYQGSSGSVYPLPVIETIDDEKKDVEYNVVFLENEYLKIMVMPSLGGRVQMAYDKTNDFHFVYYNQVIKPALVGLTGPWISGGIEFNWPQHHRPSTYEPVDYAIQENSDGSMTLWVSEIERMFRTKGAAGFTIHPDKAFLEINVKLYNGTAEPQTFLWWANPALAVDDNYQSVFPPDVHAVFDHGKRDVSTFPIATGEYYKMDYSEGVDISRFKNIPVPTSFMAAKSKYDFMGGYDHGRRSGMLHYADHHVSPGKKQWVWGCGDFGDAWHRNLTDEDGPYVELMTGVYTDNQPDFTWLMPYEQKSFTQYFMPYKTIGAVKNANNQAAVNLEIDQRDVYIGVYLTSGHKNLNIIVRNNEDIIFQVVKDIDPSTAFEHSMQLAPEIESDNLELTVVTDDGKVLISYRPEPYIDQAVPDPARPIPAPEAIETIEELYLAGRHIEQYRHATRRPEPYYQEAIKRDSGDIRSNNALGLLLYRQGRFDKAEKYFLNAIGRQQKHNSNPYWGEPYYNLGLCLNMLGRQDEAYDAFYKSTWSADMRACGYFSLARISACKGRFSQALEHIELSLANNYQNQKARHLKIILLRQTGDLESALREIDYVLQLDPLEFGVIFEKYLIYKIMMNNDYESVLRDFKFKIRGNVHNYLELSLDYSAAGFIEQAEELLETAAGHYPSEKDVYPLVYYYLGRRADLEKASRAKPNYCFPHRIETLNILKRAVEVNPDDAKAWYYLGNFWYGKKQYDLAIDSWEKSAALDDSYPTVHRNLGLAYYNQQKLPEKALIYYEKAYKLDNTDIRVLFELDQLYKKTARGLVERIAFLESNISKLSMRDDLYIEYIWLLNQTGSYHKAIELLLAHKFHPWEGGEGKVTGAYLLALKEIAKEHLLKGEYGQALDALAKTESYPNNFGEGKLHGCRENDIDYYRAIAYEGLGDKSLSDKHMLKAAIGDRKPADAIYYNDQPPEMIFYQGMAFERLGDSENAKDCFSRLLEYGQEHINDIVEIDFFAVSLPDFLIFEDDLDLRNNLHCHFLIGLANLGLNQYDKARSEFETVLVKNPAHTGAIIHNNIIPLLERL